MDDLLELLPKLIDPIVRNMNKHLATALAIFGAVVAFLVQRKEKRKQRERYKRLEYKIDILLKAGGHQWNADEISTTAYMGRRSPVLLHAGKWYALFATWFIRQMVTEKSKLKWRVKKMRDYLRKLGRTKFQAFLIMTITNAAMLILFFTGSLDLDADVEKYMPIINITTQMIVTWIYVWVEGSIDKANAQGGQTNAKYSLDDSEFVGTDSTH